MPRLLQVVGLEACSCHEAGERLPRGEETGWRAGLSLYCCHVEPPGEKVRGGLASGGLEPRWSGGRVRAPGLRLGSVRRRSQGSQGSQQAVKLLLMCPWVLSW